MSHAITSSAGSLYPTTTQLTGPACATGVRRLLRSAAFGDTICSQHQRRTEKMQKELTEQQKQTGSLQSQLDAEQLRREKAECEVSRMADQLEQRDKQTAELQTKLEALQVSQSETQGKLSGARAMIEDLENQLADLRAFSGRGRGGDVGAVAELEQEVSLRKAAEAECKRLRQELKRVASPSESNAASADENTKGDLASSSFTDATPAPIVSQLEQCQVQSQPTETYAQSQGFAADTAVTEELQALRADMQLLLKQQHPQHDRGETDRRKLQDSHTAHLLKESHESQALQQSRAQRGAKHVPLQADSEEQRRSVPSTPVSDSDSCDEFSIENGCANAQHVRTARDVLSEVSHKQHITEDEHNVAVSRAADTPKSSPHRQLPGAPRQSRGNDLATSATATARSVQSRQEVEHILSALEAARRSLDLTVMPDGPIGLQSAHTGPAASRSDFLSRSAPSTPSTSGPVRRSFAQLYQDEEMHIAQCEAMEGQDDSARLGPKRNPLLSLAGHNNRYSMY